MADDTVNDAIRRILSDGGTPFQVEQRLTAYVHKQRAAVRAENAQTIQFLQGEAASRQTTIELLQIEIAAVRAENAEQIAQFIERLRYEHQSTTEPVGKVARLIREKFGR